MSNITYLTEEGLKKLQDELAHLKNVERPSISRQIAEARDKGDYQKMQNMMLQKMHKGY